MNKDTNKTNTTEVNSVDVMNTPTNVSTVDTKPEEVSSLTSPTIKAPSVKSESESGVILSNSMLNENTLKAVENLAEYVAKSPIFCKAFEIEETTEDGSIITKIDKHAVFTCMALGVELGIEPMRALALGRTLNREAVIKVTYGKSMGLDPFFSMKDIFIWNGGGRELIYTGIHAVNACLLQIGVKTTIVKDGRITPILVNASTGEAISEPFNRNKHYFLKGLDVTVVKANMAKGMIAVKKELPSPDEIIATVTLTRKDNVITRSYSLQEAIDAELYGGTTSLGDDVKGKDNWNKYPSTHLVKMATMLAARIIAADKLGGVYIADEIVNIKHTINDNVEETSYIEID